MIARNNRRGEKATSTAALSREKKGRSEFSRPGTCSAATVISLVPLFRERNLGKKYLQKRCLREVLAGFLIPGTGRDMKNTAEKRTATR